MRQRIRAIAKEIRRFGRGGEDAGHGRRPPESTRQLLEEPADRHHPLEEKRRRIESLHYPDYAGNDPAYDHGRVPDEDAFETPVRFGSIAPVMGNQFL